MQKKQIKKVIKRLLSKKITVTTVILLLIMVGIYTYQANKPLDSTIVSLISCVDGDTAHFSVNGIDETVRFLVVDTPEISGTPEEYGMEASHYTCNALRGSEEIKLEFENDLRDKHERLLAWVWLDGKLLQESLVEEGLASVKYVYGEYKYTNLLYETQDLAQSNHIGMWE
ncbi:MAG: thermonuclease family protein [Erysipelotrichaceae bacterium]